MSAPRITLKTTNDGSHTLHTSQFDADYHSVHGARQEAMHVYIKHGLHAAATTPISLLEVGFGSGLNMLLSILHAQAPLHYTSIEPYPLNPDLALKLNFPQNEKEADLFETLHKCTWNTPVRINNLVTIEKQNTTLQNFTPKHRYNVVYYDAFGPNAQPELWQTDVFKHVYDMMEHNGILVTFCAQGQMKRNLKEANFTVTALPGPPGKREMTVATKS